MRTWTARSLAFVAAVALFAAVAVLHAQNNSQFRDWKPSAIAAGTDAKPSVSCAALVALTGYEFSVTTAAVVPAAGETPEYCRVTGLIPSEIRFELDLPVAWNGRLYMFGNGGYAGEALDGQ